MCGAPLDQSIFGETQSAGTRATVFRAGRRDEDKKTDGVTGMTIEKQFPRKNALPATMCIRWGHEYIPSGQHPWVRSLLPCITSTFPPTRSISTSSENPARPTFVEVEERSGPKWPEKCPIHAETYKKICFSVKVRDSTQNPQLHEGFYSGSAVP